MYESTTRAPDPDTDEVSDDRSGIASLRDFTRALSAIAGDAARLIAVDARLCGRTALAMIGLTVIAALLLVGGWLFIGAAAVLLLTEIEGFSPAGAVMTVGAAHIALAALAGWRLRYIARDLTFRQSRATLRSLVPTATATTSCPDARD